MKRPHFHPARCRVCGIEGSRDEISQQGYCPTHGLERFEANIEQLRAKRGPFCDHWARQMILVGQRVLVASQRAQLLDDLREKA